MKRMGKETLEFDVHIPNSNFAPSAEIVFPLLALCKNLQSSQRDQFHHASQEDQVVTNLLEEENIKSIQG